MPVTCEHTMAVINDHGIAQKPFATGKNYHPISSRHNRCAFPGGDVISLVKLPLAGKRRLSEAELGCHPGFFSAGNGPDGGGGGQQVMLIF